MNANLRANSNDKSWLWITIGVVVAAGAALLIQRTRTAPQPPAANPAIVPLPSPVVAQPEPSHHPIEEAESLAPASTLPPLDQSDEALGSALNDLVGQSLFDSLLEHKDIVRRIVATIDNMPRESAPQRLWPLKPAAGHFLVTGNGDTLATAPENALRYVPYVRLAQAVDPRKLVALYVRHYPLFQQAYEQLGYPQQYFNDRLIFVIDQLLATPPAGSPQHLSQPHVLYQYSDASLESLTFGQKTLLRMGAENEAAIKAKLVEIRRLLVRDVPPKGH